MFRRRFRTLIGASILILAPYLLASAYIRIRFLSVSNTEVQTMLTDLEKATTFSQILKAIPAGSIAWTLVLVLIYAFLVVPLFFGLVVHMTSQHVTSRHDVKLAEAGNASFRRLLPSMLTMILACLIFAVGLLLYSVVLGLIVSLFSLFAPPLAVVIAMLGSLAFLALIVWFAVRAIYIPAVVAEEGLSFAAGIRRCWRITSGQTARLLGFTILLSIFVAIAQTLLSVIGDAVFPTVGGQILVTVLVGLITTPFAYVCLSIMYLDLRSRRND